MRVVPNVKIQLVNQSRSREQFGSWSSEYAVSFGGDFELSTNDDTFRGEALDFEVTAGDTLHMVYAIYSSGDSFGSGKCNGQDIVAIYKDADKAQNTIKVLIATPDDDAEVVIQTEGGRDLRYYRPWLGYFEHLEELVLWSGPAVWSQEDRDRINREKSRIDREAANRKKAAARAKR